MPTCARCGAHNAEGAKFCSECGAKLAAEAPERREERKVVTVLFADLVGFTARSERLDPEDVRAFLAPYFAHLRSELERHGGSVEKFIGDAVVALFGAPVAHEDDPERAVRAALAIRDWVAEQDGDLQVRIAVNTGEALVALDARPEEGEGIAAGDVVNTTARLQAAAPSNGILVGETTYRATRHAIDYGQAAPVEAKGKAEPIRVWRAIQARARFGTDVRHPSRAPLVGRQRELDVLRDALERAREDSSPQLVTFVGVPGIGKSRLVYELFQVVEGMPDLITWRQGRSLAYGDGVTFWALGEMVKAEAGILESDRAAAAAEKLDRSVGDLVAEAGEAQWILRQLRPLVGLAVETEAGGDRQAEAFAAWRRYLEALAEQRPLVLVFEDLHWADEGLLDFVDHLVEWASGVPMLVLGTGRPELLARRPGWGGGKPNATTLSLSPLADDDTARLVAALLDRTLLPAETQASLLERAQGNPLYAEEFVRMLADRGSTDVAIPETVQGLIAARLDALEPEEKALVQDAAVVGKAFWLGAVAALGDGDRWGAERLLHALERREFVRRERRSSVAGDVQYVFLHLLVRDVAYGQIPRAARAEKHQAAAEWIESLGRAEDTAEMLAHHYLAALEYARAAAVHIVGLEERARVALREAGDRAAALNAFGTAARFYGEALGLSPPDDPARLDMLFGLAQSVFFADASDLVEVLERASDELARAERPEQAAEIVSLLSFAERTRGNRQRAMELIAEAAARVDGLPASRSKARVLTHLARHRMLDDHPGTIEAARSALAMADELSLPEFRANALNTVGFARLQAGDLEGLADLEASMAVASSANAPFELVRGYVNLAAALSGLGEVGQARENLRAAAEAAERFGSAIQQRWIRGSELDLAYSLGEWDEGMAISEEFISASEAGSPHSLEQLGRAFRAVIRVARGDVDGALVDDVRQLELARLEPQFYHSGLWVSAFVRLEAGRIDEARSRLEELLAALARRAPAFAELSWPNLAFACAGVGRGDIFLDLASRIRVPSRWLDAGRAFVLGDFEHAAEVYAEIGSLPDEAYARLRAAEGLAAEGRRAEADAQLRRALAFYRSVGATKYVREGEALLAASA